MSQLFHHQDPSLRAGLVGCGKIGSHLDEGNPTYILSHASAYASTPGVELVAICDSNQDRLTDCGKARGITSLYSNFQKMLEAENLDIVSVCTPASQRFEIIKAAVKAKVKVILCEKPMAPSLLEGQAIAEVINGSATTLVLNFQRRWDPGIQQAA